MGTPHKAILAGTAVGIVIFAAIPAHAQTIESYQNFSTDRFRTVADINGDGVLEILELFEEQVHAYRITDHAPEYLPGWPQDVDSTQWSTYSEIKNLPPAVGNILADHPGLELACLTYYRYPESGAPDYEHMILQIFAPDGTLLVYQEYEDYIPYALVLADLDDDGDQEIVIGSNFKAFPWYNNVLALQGDGSLFDPAFPVNFEFISYALVRLVSVAVGDVDGNGDLEIVYAAVINPPGVGEPDPTAVYVINHDGSPLAGWGGGVFIPADEGGIQRPVLADLDQDGTLEIIISTKSAAHSYLHVYRANGQEYCPRRYAGYIAAAPVVGDLNGDDWLEIVVSDIGNQYTRVFDHLGTSLSSFPGGGEMALADVDGDGIVEIITGSAAGANPAVQRINAFRYTDSSQPTGWPVYPGSFVGSEWSIYNWVPTVENLDGDEELEVLLGNTLLEVPVVCSPDDIEWPMFQHDRRHTAQHGARMAVPGDLDGDGDVDLADLGGFVACMTGPAGGPIDPACWIVDFDADDDVDMKDFAAFAAPFTAE